MKNRRTYGRLKYVLIFLGVVAACWLCYFLGVTEMVYQKPFSQFSYPLNVDFVELLKKFRENENFRPRNPLPITNTKVDYMMAPKRCWIPPDERWDASGEVYLLIVVKSAIPNVRAREVIRETWGDERLAGWVVVRTVFLLGMDYSSPAGQNQIFKEYKMYDDIVQGNFADSYYNNTWKAIMGFDYAAHKCSNARFVLFIDDDYYLSLPAVIQFINLQNQSGDAQLMAGYVWNWVMPLRHHSSKWYISVEEYPFWIWPPYVAAGAYVCSMRTVHDLLFAMAYTRWLRFDDVFLGIVAYKAGIPVTHVKEFHSKKLTYKRETYRHVIAVHGYKDPEEMKSVWKDMILHVHSRDFL